MAESNHETGFLRSAKFYCVGVSHKTSGLDLLERLSLTAQAVADRLRSALDEGCADCRVEEVLLSTCNRLEIYWAKSESEGCGASRRQVERLRNAVAEIDGAFYLLQDEDAARHLFRVASGLESAVVGEYEIQGQTTSALAAAQEAGTAGPFLTELFQSALRCGKRARAETLIGRNASSMSSVAVQLASEAVADLPAARVTVVGAGETGELTLKALVHRGVRQINVVNRTRARAREISDRWGGKPHTIPQLAGLLAETDILITAARSSVPLVDRPMAQGAMTGRPEASRLAIIDIGVPRNVAPDVAEVEGVHLNDLEAIKAAHLRNRRERLDEVPRVEAIVDEEIGHLQEGIGELLMRPLLAGFWKRAEAIREDVMSDARGLLPNLRAEEWDGVERLARSLVRRLLQTPARRLRDEAGDETAREHAATIGYLFDIVPHAGQYRQCRHADEEIDLREEKAGGMRA
jgi:glutamyl-tRNA reductase